MVRLIGVMVSVSMMVCMVCSGGFARQKPVQQASWPGTCAAQAWSADGRSAVGFFAGPVPALVRWNGKSNEALSYQPITGLAGPELVDYASLSPDSRHLVIGVKHEGAQVIDTATAKTVMVLQHGIVGFGQQSELLLEMRSQTVRVWDVSRRRVVASVKTTGSDFLTAEISPNGKMLATIDVQGKGALWDVPTGKRLRMLRKGVKLQAPLAFSPDSRYLAIGADDPGWRPPDFVASEAAYARTYRLTLWDTRNGRRILSRPDHYSLDGGTDAFIFTEGGKRLLSCGMDSIDVWSVPSGRKIRSFTGSGEMIRESPGNSHRGPQRPFALSLDGKTLAAGPERWSIPSFKLVSSIPVSWPAARWVAFSSDGSMLAAIMSRDMVAVWDLRTARVIRWIHPSWAESSDTRVAFPELRKLAVYVYASDIELYDPVDGKGLDIARPPVARQANSWVRLSPDGRLLVGDVWDGQQMHLEIWDAASGAIRGRIEPPTSAGRSSSASVDALLPSGGARASGGEQGDMFPMYIVDSAFSPDGRWLVAEADEKHVILCDLKTGGLRGLPGIVGQYSFSPDGALLAGYRREGSGYSVVLVNVADGTIRSTLGSAAVEYDRPVAFSPDGKQVAAVAGSQIRLYATEAGKPVLHLEAVGAVRQIAFDPKGRWIAGTSGLGVTLWDAKTGKVCRTLSATPSATESAEASLRALRVPSAPLHTRRSAAGSASRSKPDAPPMRRKLIALCMAGTTCGIVQLVRASRRKTTDRHTVGR